VRAAAHGDIESVTLMLNAAGSPDAAAALASGTASVAPTTLGLSPLGAAAARGHDDVVRALVAAKADVNAFSGADPVAPQTHSGLMTPVMLAAACGHAATVRALLALGADAKRARPADGADALTAAATRGEAAGIEAVLCAGGDDAAAVKAWVNTASPLGWTPLMLAGLAGNEGGVRTLLAAGADATAQTGKGETALSWASRTGRAGAINALKEAMATEGEKTA
jgi:ankyrin repeat protein